MKYKPIYQSEFRHNYRTCAKRGYDMSALKTIMAKLENGEPLDPTINRPHWLTGRKPRTLECHIESDWLLEYRYDGDKILFTATGTHADLFR